MDLAEGGEQHPLDLERPLEVESPFNVDLRALKLRRLGAFGPHIAEAREVDRCLVLEVVEVDEPGQLHDHVHRLGVVGLDVLVPLGEVLEVLLDGGVDRFLEHRSDLEVALRELPIEVDAACVDVELGVVGLGKDSPVVVDLDLVDGVQAHPPIAVHCRSS